MYSALTSLLGALGLGSGEAPVGEGTPIDWESDVVAGGPLAEVPRAYVEGAFKGAHGGDDFQWDKLEESDRMLGVGVTAVVKVRRAACPEGPCLAGEQERRPADALLRGPLEREAPRGGVVAQQRSRWPRVGWAGWEARAHGSGTRAAQWAGEQADCHARRNATVWASPVERHATAHIGRSLP